MMSETEDFGRTAINLQFEIGPGAVSVKITRLHGGESGLVAGLDFKSSCGLPEGRLGGFDSHAPPPFVFDLAFSWHFPNSLIYTFHPSYS